MKKSILFLLAICLSISSAFGQGADDVVEQIITRLTL